MPGQTAARLLDPASQGILGRRDPHLLLEGGLESRDGQSREFRHPGHGLLLRFVEVSLQMIQHLAEAPPLVPPGRGLPRVEHGKEEGDEVVGDPCPREGCGGRMDRADHPVELALHVRSSRKVPQ